MAWMKFVCERASSVNLRQDHHTAEGMPADLA